MKLSSEYHTLSTMIKASVKKDQLIEREKQIERHYNMGTISAHEFQRLDSMILDRLVKLGQ